MAFLFESGLGGGEFRDGDAERAAVDVVEADAVAEFDRRGLSAVLAIDTVLRLGTVWRHESEFSSGLKMLRFRMQRGRRWLLGILVLAGPVGVLAFEKPEPKRTWAESAELMVLHQYDWAFYDNGIPRMDSFSKDNTWSWIQLRERDTSKLLWEKPIMPLEHLWISPDSAYLVGLSSHQRHTKHLVVYRRDGTQALALNAETEMPMLEWKLFSAPYVRWYDIHEPEPAIVREDGKVYLTLQTRSWGTSSIQHKRVRIEVPQSDAP